MNMTENPRKPQAPIDRLFLDRWSPRAFDPAPIPDETLKTLFEAARWSQSCFNEQPWLFVYATTQEERGKILGILSERNRSWAATAPVLLVLFAKRRFDEGGKPNRWAGFDCGTAWMALTLQARLLGLYTHGMAGFRAAEAYQALGVPEADYEAMCVIALGKIGDPASIPEGFREREKPNTDRKELEEVARKISV